MPGWPGLVEFNGFKSVQKINIFISAIEEVGHT